MWRSHFNLNVKTTCSGMLKTKVIMTYFGHNSFYFLSFQNYLRQMPIVVVREVADREVADREVVDRDEEG